MSCKISWPDRTQLLKHSQECPNSQVVRTKTKYKLKANHRVQLKFYLLSLIDYWTHERDYRAPAVQANARCFLKNVFASKRLLLDTASRHQLTAIHTDQAVLRLDDDNNDNDDQSSATATVNATSTDATPLTDNTN